MAKAVKPKKPKIKCSLKSKCAGSLLPDYAECLGCTHNNLVAGQWDNYKPKPRMTPLQFHALPENKKLDAVVKTYFALCSEQEMVVNGKIQPCFFMLRKHFQRENPAILQVFYDWLYTIKEKTPISLTDAYAKVRQHQVSQRQVDVNDDVQVEALPSLLSLMGGLR